MLLVRTVNSIRSVHGREAPLCDLCIKTDEEADSWPPFPWTRNSTPLGFLPGPHLGPQYLFQEPFHRSPASAQPTSPLQPSLLPLQAHPRSTSIPS